MTARRAKQIIYGAFYLIVIGGIAAGFYFLFIRQPASCFDKIQNQGETGVDCGGPCATVCTTAVRDLVVGDFQTFVSVRDHYTFLARVENYNSDLAAKSFAYSFNLYDASGTILRSFPGWSFAYASEAKYLVLPNVASAVPFDHAGLVVQDPDWIASSTMGSGPRFGNPISVTENTVSTSTITVAGQLTNSDISAFGPVYLVAIFYGSNGLPAGASQAQLDAIAPNQSLPFSVSYPVASGTVINPALTKVYAYAQRP